jgi:uncharacterized phage protein gp47/JayE
MTRDEFGFALRERRRSALSNDLHLRGLDYVEVVGPIADGRVLALNLHFVGSNIEGKSAAPPMLTPSNIRIGGPFGELKVTVSRIDAVNGVVGVLVTPPGIEREWDTPIPFAVELRNVPDLDPFFASVKFRLHHGGTSLSPNDPISESDRGPLPAVDYLAKDYASFRTLILDSMTLGAPNWEERQPADLGMTLVEMLAYVGDGLSYYQDAVATERYLETARLRTSIRRHLRLIGYRLHDGCNSRVWMHVGVQYNIELNRGTVFLASKATSDGARIHPADLARIPTGSVQIYESMHDAHLAPEQNRLEIYTWGAEEFSLPAGSVRATLKGHIGSLKQGSVIIFELAPETGGRRAAHAVRLSKPPAEGLDMLFREPISEIEWFDEDALPEPMPVSSSKYPDVCLTVALGNIILADFGRRVSPQELEIISGSDLYRPVLPDSGLTFACPYKHVEASARSAAAALRQDPRVALGAVTVETQPLRGDSETWLPTRDLLQTSSDDPCFVVETESEETAFLRFGDGRFGKRPIGGERATAEYRLGNGPRGNSAPNTIDRIVSLEPGIMEVRNPLAAFGGEEPESIEQARLLAPSAVWTSHRCVTDDDYRREVEQLPGVARAFVKRTQFGARTLVKVFVQRDKMLPATTEFLSGIAESIEPMRLLGVTVEILPPRFVPIHVDITVWLWPDAVASRAKRLAIEALSSGEDGLFRSDRWSFGDHLHASALVERVIRVQGVRSAMVEGMEVIGSTPSDGLTLRPKPDEILHLDTDPRNPIGLISIEFKN